MLPDSEGFQTLEKIQQNAPDIPIVILTGQADDAFALDTLQKGAQDYLVKGTVDGDLMARSLLYSIERRRLQEKLRKNESRLAEAQALAHIGSWESDLNTNEVDWSDELCRIFGLKSGEYTPSQDTHYSFIHPDDRQFVKDTIENLLKNHEPVEFNHRLVRKDGEILHIRARTQITLDKNQKPIRLVGTCHDITAYKKLEEQVLFAGRMASVGTLASGVAHEINNPLHYILGNIDFTTNVISSLGQRLDHMQAMLATEPQASAHELWELLDGSRLVLDLSETKEALNEALTGVERVRNVVRDLKVFSRSEEEHYGPVLVTKVLESAINMSHNEIRHRAQLVKSFTGVPPVDGNESRLGQVFLNILINAAHSIPEGRIDNNEIRVSTHLDRKGNVVIEIQDTGSGIKPETLQRIFDPFFTTKPVGVGTGLGLSICRSIVSAHGGEIEVQSEVGKGSLFRVILPPSKVAQRPARAHSSNHTPLRRGRLLVIDDELSLLKVFKRLFASEHDLVTLSRAREALEMLLSGEQFDLILCDLMMPDLTGIDLYDELCTKKPLLAQKMIFLTGGAFTPKAREFLEQIPNHRVEKPIDTRSLRSLIQTLLR
jgi:PAS domain S-box-containing protein